MAEDFGERFDIKLRDFNRPTRKSVPDFMEFDLFEVVPLDEPGKELTIGARLCRFRLAGQKILIWIVCHVLFDDIPE